MSDERTYRNRVIRIFLLGVVFWLVFGVLSQIGIFSFGLDFGFGLIVRRYYAVFGLTLMLLLITLSIIVTVAYRHHFPKLNEQFEKAKKDYKEMNSFRKVAFWIIMFGVLLQVIVSVLPFYIYVLTDILFYDFGLFEGIIATILIIGFIMMIISSKKGSTQKLDSAQKVELDVYKGKEGERPQETIRGFSRRTMFKILLLAHYLMIAMAIFFNFRGMLFTTDMTKIVFHLTLQIISVPLYVLFLIWVFKFRRKYFSMEPEERKLKYKKMWVLVIITYFLFFGIIAYEFFITEIIESMYGPYSLIQFLFELSFIFVFMFLCFGVVIAVLPKLKTD